MYVVVVMILIYRMPPERVHRPTVRELLTGGYLREYTIDERLFMALNPIAAKDLRRFDRRQGYADFRYEQRSIGGHNNIVDNSLADDPADIGIVVRKAGLSIEQAAIAILLEQGYHQHEVGRSLGLSTRTINRAVQAIKTALKQGVSND